MSINNNVQLANSRPQNPIPQVSKGSIEDSVTLPQPVPPLLRPAWWEGIPLRLREKLIWQESTAVTIPRNAIILLYVGKADGLSLDEMLVDMSPHLANRIVALDLVRCERTHNLLNPEPYNSICTAASKAGLTGVVGGPMCRTWTVRRLVPKKGGGLPCRGLLDING